MKLCQLPCLLGQYCIDFTDTVIGLLQLDRNAAAAALLSLQILFIAGDGLLIMLNGAAENGDLPFDLLAGALQHGNIFTQGIHGAVLVTQVCAHLLGRAIQLFQFFMGLFQHKGGGGIVLLCFFCIGRKLFQLVHPNCHFYALQFLPQRQILCGLFRLNAQRL